MIGYIYYVHPTMTYEQIEETTRSINYSRIADKGEKTSEFNLYIHNTSDLDSSHLENLLTKYGNWKSVHHLDVNHGNVAADIRYQLQQINDHRIYVCHKGDFFLGYRSVQNAINIATAKVPVWLGFSKFDLREDFNPKFLPHYYTLTFDEIIRNGDAIDLTMDSPTHSDIENYKMFGYRGVDGTMHVYNEEARNLIHVNTYWSEDNVKFNHSEQGIAMLYGINDIVGFHIFHELPNGRNKYKDVKGYRF